MTHSYTTSGDLTLPGLAHTGLCYNLVRAEGHTMSVRNLICLMVYMVWVSSGRCGSKGLLWKVEGLGTRAGRLNNSFPDI